MAAGNEFKITSEIRSSLAELFIQQYSLVETNPQKLFSFGKGEYASIEYHNKISYEHNNVVYGHQGNPVMSVFAFSGKRFLKIQKLLDKADLKILGLRVFKNSIIPLHVDPNYGSTGRENPILFLVVSGSEDCGVYISNRKDGSKQVMIPGLSKFVLAPTEIEHGAYAADQDMDIVQIMVESV